MTTTATPSASNADPASTAVDPIDAIDSLGKQAARDYHILAHALATGKPRDPAVMAQILKDAGKSTADLRRDVETQKRRITLADRLKGVPALERENQLIVEKLAAADEKLREAEQQHRDTTEPLLTRQESIRYELSDASRVRDELMKTCTDPDVLEAVADVQRRLDVCHAERRELVQRLERCEVHGTKFQGAIDNLKVKIADVDARIERLGKASREARERFLIP